MISSRLVVIGILLLTGCVTPAETPETTNLPLAQPQQVEGHEHHLFEKYANVHNLSYTDTQSFFLNNHGITEKEIYEKLPPMPTYFNTWNAQWESGEADWLNDVPYAVYAQPEFYPTFQTTGITSWIQAPEQPMTTIGIATTPAEQTSPVQEGENEIETTLFISNTWGGTQYQGMRLTYSIEPAADSMLVFEPAELMVGPTFPAFDQNWVQKIRITGRILAEKGQNYTIKIGVGNPSLETAQKWAEQYPSYENVSPFVVSSDGIATLSLIPTPPSTDNP